jgi:hypothetical protein
VTTPYNGNAGAVTARAVPTIPISVDADDLNSALLNTPLMGLADVAAFLQTYAALLGSARPNQDTLQVDGPASDQVPVLRTRRPSGNVKLLWEAETNSGATKIRLYVVKNGGSQPGFFITYNSTILETGGGQPDGPGTCYWYSFGSSGFIASYYYSASGAAFGPTQMTQIASIDAAGLHLPRGDSLATPGDTTLNTPSGFSSMPANASWMRITNKLVTLSSIVLVVPINLDAGNYISSVSCNVGEILVSLSKAATTVSRFAWVVIN